MVKISIGGGDLGAGSGNGSPKRRGTDSQIPAVPNADLAAGVGASRGGGAYPGKRRRSGGGRYDLRPFRGFGWWKLEHKGFLNANLTAGVGTSRGEGAYTRKRRRSGGGRYDFRPFRGISWLEKQGLDSEEDEEDVDGDGEGGAGGGEEEEYKEKEEEGEGEEAGVEERRGAPAPDKSVTCTLTDTDVLDCAICSEPLRSPIFQCENGHIACSSCCVKMANKCPSCLMPIGYNRCRALEKVLECVRLTCNFSNYGCKETISYEKRKDHEKSCPHVPCYCPLTHCSFIGSSKQLSRHFTLEHPGSGTSFRFNTCKSICLRFDTKFHVLQEESEDVLFLLTNRIDPLGNKMTISCIGPSSKGDHLYDLMTENEHNYLKFWTYTRSIQEPLRHPQQSPYLMIPKGFFGSATTMRLEFLIHDYLRRL